MNRAHEIFEDAVDRPGPERAAFLDGACRGDPAVRTEVESLLRAHDGARSFLGEPTRGGATLDAPLRERPGTLIGRYKLLEQIGEGGFGVVFLAEQREPVTRKVALKIIKLGMDTRQVIARFEAERQALAMMDHPNIAKVLDAGETETGRPYFVMELVRGDPITQYCDTNNLSVEARLGLFEQVCYAVQHAHQKGVIHRDIKPSNVLITIADGKPIPKVIDFGIAKATSARLTEKTLFTEHRALIGTPAYMSPEQAEMSGVDMDTRSDIYSLGVLLYELLTGTTPFDTKSLMAAGLAEIQRIIREVEPEKPSTRLSMPAGAPTDRSGGAALHEIAARRDVDHAALRRQVRGDLDWIVMKCLEKERARRYETASNLAQDVERYQRHEPVMAGPPSRAYRLRKFVRRNRALVTGATLLAAALLAGIAGTTLGLVRAEQRRAEAEAAREREREQRELAQKRQEETEQVADFQSAMLSGIDAEDMGRGIKKRFREKVRAALKRQFVGQPPDLRPRTPEEIEAELTAFDERAGEVDAVDVARQVMGEFVLAGAADAVEKQFAEQPLVRAQLHSAIGKAYTALGSYGAAEQHVRAALHIVLRLLGDDHPDTLTSMNAMGFLLEAQGKPAEAEPYYREALGRRRRVLGDEHPDTLTSINNLGMLLLAQGKLAEAERYLREALGSRRVLGDEHPDTLTSINNMGLLLKAQGKVAEAEGYYREVLEKCRRVLGEEDPHTLASINNLGVLLQAQGKPAEAEAYVLEALEKRRRVLGDDHPDTLGSILNLGSLLQDQRKPAEAEGYLREGLEKSRRVLGEEHQHTLTFINNLGLFLKDQGKPAEAEGYLREAMEKSRRLLGDEHPNTVTSINNMGLLLQAQGKLAEAESNFREALEKFRRVLGDEHPNTLTSIDNVGAVLRAQGKLADAEPYYREAFEAKRRALPPDSPALAVAQARFSSFLLALGTEPAAAKAETLLRECLAIRERAVPDDDPQVWLRYSAMSLLGAALAGQGKFAEAEPLLLDGYNGMKDDPRVPPANASADRKREALERLVKLYESWDRGAPGTGKADRAAEWRAELESLPGP